MGWSSGRVFDFGPDTASYITFGSEPGLSSEKVYGTDINMTGTDAEKPAASMAGRQYFATDSGKTYRDTGMAWVQIAAPVTISNSDVAPGAAITCSKLNLTGSVTNTDLAGSIDLSKLASDPLARANHTGTQEISTVSGLQTALDGKPAKLSGLTQTYASTSTTHANLTSTALTNSSGGATDGTVQAMPALQATPTGLVSGERTAIINNFAELTTQLNNLRSDVEEVKKFLNSVVDGLE
jgi:hypothetical protein